MRKAVQWVTLQDCADFRGNMNVISCGRELSFDVKRVFFMYNQADASVRGNHANLFSREAFVCLQGSCNLFVDDGEQKYAYVMNDPQKMLIVEPYTWIVVDNFSKDCILLVLSDRLYSDADYENDYETFLKRYKDKKEAD